MLKEFVRYIEDMAFINFQHEGRTFTNHEVYPIRDAQPKPLTVHTLEGILDYVHCEGLNKEDVYVHVEDYNAVWLYSKLYGREKQRDHFITAQAYKVEHKFSANLTLKEFLTYIQAGFVPDENTAAILAALGNIVDETGVEYADDGVTQIVTARTGITRRGQISLPNPVTLRPYRTFPDVAQPEGLFVLRVDKVGDKIVCMLTEADGGRWKQIAVESIKEWFMSEGLTDDGLRLKVVG